MIKRAVILIFASFIFVTCAGQPAVISAQEIQETIEIEEFQEIKYAIIPESPRPGEPITVALNKEAKEVLLLVNNKQVSKAGVFFVPPENKNPGFHAAIIAIGCTVDAAKAVIRINNKEGLLCEIPIDIAPREFRSETLALNPALTKLVSQPDPVKEAESNRLWQILITTGDHVYHYGNFILPTSSTRRTSQYGTRRVNQYSDGRKVTSIHAGVDFGIPTGSEVLSCGTGKVILSRMRVLTGNSIIIEHAPGVYSIYYHLDSVIAKEGTIVGTGAIIGLSGSTGFSTGPHLHWELRVSTENTDPDAFVSRPLIDKDLIISKIFNIVKK